MDSSNAFNEIPICPACKEGNVIETRKMQSNLAFEVVIKCNTCGAQLKCDSLTGKYMIRGGNESFQARYKERLFSSYDWNRIAHGEEFDESRSGIYEDAIENDNKKGALYLSGMIIIGVGIAAFLYSYAKTKGILDGLGWLGIILSFFGAALLFSGVAVSSGHSQSANSNLASRPAPSIVCPMCHLEMFMEIDECPRCHHRLK